MGARPLRVKCYSLAGDGVQITLSMEDSNEIELTYEDKHSEYKFTGRAIYREDTQIGFLANAVLEEGPKPSRKTLSLAVPLANIPDGMRSVNVNSFAVITDHLERTDDPPRHDGQVQTYKVHALKGNAW